ncbi:UDP-3-O-(3-hydroxymyristoyl)glucosamine N-acyltransferase [Lampropedia puyangensis]|uniref:UDP-3-O-acylglucosamine N-acyltransferase n=1 Tax=Lampropedia puyangensis TaxID=1330072 RepID=A0A4S8F8B8_9BURK|nr:UDP-3-O-(3-hydroxymyristoyl)glucosamine N-acyltransferase [Lampropedia puyangensis]THU03740.1 UDP-3-O-(3-hydroxymyristoyl)glucosamine N-acyltransferase [Lampropedia puyangensis]
MTAITLAEIAQALGGQLHGDASILISAIAPLETAGLAEITFLSDARLVALLQSTRAACVIVHPAQAEQAQARGACIVTRDPYLYFARLTQWWRKRLGDMPEPGIHPSAVVHPDAQIDPTASVGALSVIEAGVHIGAHTRIGSRVTIERHCVIGARCVVQSGAVIGGDGFGFAKEGQTWVKIEQLGAVHIGDDVEIGANTCIDRGALGNTVLAQGVKLDNLIQIAHNVQVGENTAMAACVGISGSTKIGANCTLAGGVGVVGHIELADNTHVSGATVISRSLTEPGRYTGVYPFEPHAKWEQNAAVLRQLKKMRDRIKSLEKELAATQARVSPQQES